MRFVSGTPLWAMALLTITSVAAVATPPSAAALLRTLSDDSIALLEKSHGKRDGSGCAVEDSFYRRDWEALTTDERRDYIKAVKCLQGKPSQIDPVFAPGARTRYDDFSSIHINLTQSIHSTGNFLVWHRYVTWAYEKALRDECGYDGYQPYWNWFTYTDNPYESPLFDGSDSSLGGDGEFFEHNGTLWGQGKIWAPSGWGGGCVTTGPFANLEVRLGPVAPGMQGLPINPNGRLGYDPRCLRRDLSPYILTTWMTYQNLYNLTLGPASRSIKTFQDELGGRFDDGFAGMHGAGHFAVGGDASDPYSSMNDPSFFLHHAMVDMVYWIWQTMGRDDGRAWEIDGTLTLRNNPPSRDAVKEDAVLMGDGLLGVETRTIADLLDTMGGTPFCYYYR